MTITAKFVSVVLSLVFPSAIVASLPLPDLAALGNLDEVRFTYVSSSGLRVEITAFRSSPRESISPSIHAHVFEPANRPGAQNDLFRSPLSIENFKKLEALLLERELMDRSLAFDSSALVGEYWLIQGSRGSFTIRHLRSGSEVLGDSQFANLVRVLVRLAHIPIPDKDLRKILADQTSEPPARPTAATEPTLHYEVGLLEPGPVFDDYIPPKVVSRQTFEFPDDLKEGLDGKVTVRFSVSSTGKVEDVKILNSTDERLSEIAVRGVQKWVCEPRIEGDVPVSSWIIVPIVFRSKEPEEADEVVDSTSENARLNSKVSPEN